MKNVLALLILIFLISCKTDQIKDKKTYDKFIIDRNLVNNDTIKLLSKYPELKLYRTDISESKGRSAYIVQTSSILNIEGTSDNYKCKAGLKMTP